MAVDYFRYAIQPLNDELGEKLGIRKIEVKRLYDETEEGPEREHYIVVRVIRDETAKEQIARLLNEEAPF